MRMQKEERSEKTNMEILKCLERLNFLEIDQEATTRKFAEMRRHNRSIGSHVGWDDNYFDLMEPPAHWMRSRPVVVCLYRLIQLRPTLHSLFLAWSPRYGHTTWTCS